MRLDIQIQHLLKLNSKCPTDFPPPLDSNTTLVKVKCRNTKRSTGLKNGFKYNTC